MKMSRLLVLITICVLFAGCAATRPLTDMAAGAGGGALASELSKGDPGITAAGAAGGVLISEGLQYASAQQAKKAELAGYEKGRSDAVKQQYWILINQQKEKGQQQEQNVRYYEVPVPEQKIDGVILNPTTKYLRIEE